MDSVATFNNELLFDWNMLILFEEHTAIVVLGSSSFSNQGYKYKSLFYWYVVFWTVDRGWK